MIGLYKLIPIPIALALSLGAIGFLFAKRRGRSPIFWPLIGAFLGIALFISFRTYKILPLNPDSAKTISSNAIIKTKQLSIPGYPDAYNPSLIPYEEGYLLSFRVRCYDLKTFVKKVLHSKTSYVGLVKLDQNLQICKAPYLLDIASYDDSPSTSAQDGRLFRFGEKILFFFNDHSLNKQSNQFQYVVELVENRGKLQSKKRATLLDYKRMGSIEKNWTPFVSANRLYLIYAGNPHLILEPNLETGICQKIAATDAGSIWKWGEMRGGTIAESIEEGFLTFFHSSQDRPAASFFGPKTGRNYAMGAYLFEKTPPFRVKKISASPLGTLEDYEKSNRRKVVFPSGMVFDGNLIHLAWGKNDNKICITTFDKEKLLSSMSSCNAM